MLDLAKLKKGRQEFPTDPTPSGSIMLEGIRLEHASLEHLRAMANVPVRTENYGGESGYSASERSFFWGKRYSFVLQKPAQPQCTVEYVGRTLQQIKDANFEATVNKIIEETKRVLGTKCARLVLAIETDPEIEDYSYLSFEAHLRIPKTELPSRYLSLLIKDLTPYIPEADSAYIIVDCVRES